MVVSLLRNRGGVVKVRLWCLAGSTLQGVKEGSPVAFKCPGGGVGQVLTNRVSRWFAPFGDTSCSYVAEDDGIHKGPPANQRGDVVGEDAVGSELGAVVPVSYGFGEVAHEGELRSVQVQGRDAVKPLARSTCYVRGQIRWS